MNKKTTDIAILAAFWILLCPPAHAAILLHESFEGYSTGTLIGQTTSSTGLTGNWTRTGGADGDFTVSTASAMTYSSGDISVNGGSQYGVGSYVGTTGVAANIQLGSGLTLPADTSTFYYVSFLMRYNGTLDSSDNFALQFANTDSAASILRTGVRDDGTADKAWLANNASSSYLGTPTLSAGTTYFAVVKLAKASGAWSATMYLNPNDRLNESGDNFACAIGGTAAMSYMGFKLQNADSGDSFNLDEIRIGNTWADVTTTIPESSTWTLLGPTGLVAGLVGMGLLALAGFRMFRRASA